MARLSSAQLGSAQLGSAQIGSTWLSIVLVISGLYPILSEANYCSNPFEVLFYATISREEDLYK